MKIYILDNEVKQQYKLEGLLEHIMFRKGWKFQKIECYSTPNQLLHALCQKGSHQLFLMDVALDGDNYKGIELAKYIRLIDPYANIVFFSNHMECIPLVLNHQLAALDFIPKDIQARELEKRIESVLNQVKHKVSFKMIFIMSTKERIFNFPLNHFYILKRQVNLIIFCYTQSMKVLNLEQVYQRF